MKNKYRHEPPKIPVKGYVNNYWITREGVVKRIRTNKDCKIITDYNTPGYKFFDKTFHRIIDLWVENGIINIDAEKEYIYFADGNRFNLDFTNLCVGLIEEREKEISNIVNKEVKRVNDNFFLAKDGTLYEIDNYTNDFNIIKPTFKEKKHTYEFKYHLDGFELWKEADRLVAEKWVENPDKKKFYEVCHKDGNYFNIHADNLEWTDYYIDYSVTKKDNTNEEFGSVRFVDRTKLNLKANIGKLKEE